MPIREYDESEREKKLCGIPVTVKIHSTQRDMTGTGFFGDAVQNGDTPDKILENAEKESVSGEAGVYVLTTTGSLVLGETGFSLMYDEEGEEPGDVCKTEISFSPCRPKYVTVARNGAFCTVFAAEEGKRQYSVYNTPYGNLEMCIYAKRVDNRISENGGILILDYAVELKGLTAQRTKMRVDVKVNEKNEA